MNAVVVLAHGSSEEEARAAWHTLEGAVRAALAGPDVPALLFQFGMDGLPGALDTLAARGAGRITVLPFFLFPGFHLRRTVPALLDEWRKKHPDVHVTLASPFGQDARVAALLAAQIRNAAETTTEG